MKLADDDLKLEMDLKVMEPLREKLKIEESIVEIKEEEVELNRLILLSLQLESILD